MTTEPTDISHHFRVQRALTHIYFLIPFYTDCFEVKICYVCAT